MKDFYKLFNRGTSEGVKKEWETRKGGSPAHDTREAHEMTRQEYREKAASGFDEAARWEPSHDSIKAAFSTRPESTHEQRLEAKKMAQETREGKNRSVELMHRGLVKMAINGGKKVHPGVFNDYPDLKPK